jgi:hypothetical protein
MTVRAFLLSILALAFASIAQAQVSIGPQASGSGTPANPTATAGPAAVNGSASTYMRSDAAPAVQKATGAQFGIVEGDGSTVTLTGGVISVTTPAVPTLFVGATAGSANTYTIASPTPSGFTLTNQYVVRATISATNTGASTLNVNSTGATAIESNSSSGLAALVGGELITGLQYDFTYNSTCTCFVALNTAGSAVLAGTSQTVTAAQWAAWTEFDVSTAAQTITLPAVAGLSPKGGIAIKTIGQSVTLAPNAADAVNGGSTGSSVTIASGLTSFVSSIAANTVNAQPTTNGAGTISSSSASNFAYYSDSTTLSGATIASGALPMSQGASAPIASHYTDNGTNDILTQGVNVTASALSDGSSIAVNAALSNTFTLTLGASGHTLSNPTNALAGQWLSFVITGAGNTMLFDTAYKDSAGNSFGVTLNASNTTTISCEVITTAPLLTCYGPQNSASAQPATVAAPTAPNSTASFTMQGLSNGATVFTPKTSGNVQITVSGNVVTSDTTAGDGVTWQLTYGTGNGPSANAALTGTQVGGVQTAIIPATVTAIDFILPFSKTIIVNGLTVGTAYYVDLAAKALTATGTGFTNVDISVMEIR